MLADHFFKFCMQALRVLGSVAGHWHRRIEAQDVTAFLFGPDRETGDHGRSGVRGDFGEAGVGASAGAEEIDEDAFLERGVLIDQDADRLVLMQGAEDGAGAVAL